MTHIISVICWRHLVHISVYMYMRLNAIICWLSFQQVHSTLVIHKTKETAAMATVLPMGCEPPGKNDPTPSLGRSKRTAASWTESYFCGDRDWKVAAFQDTVECMGFGPIFDAGSPWVRRAFWITIVLLGWLLAVYQCVQQMEAYFEWPVSSVVDIRYV